MFDLISGIPVLFDTLNITDDQLSDMRDFMSKKQDLADGDARLYTGDTSDILAESQILSHPTFQCLQKPVIELAKRYLQEVTTTSDEFEPYIMKLERVVMLRNIVITMLTFLLYSTWITKSRVRRENLSL